VKKNNFNNLYKKIMENNTAGGAMSVFGDVSTSWGEKTANDNRIPKIIGGTIKRTPPELTVFATGKKSKNSKKPKKNAKQK
jgi:hypothetical protein